MTITNPKALLWALLAVPIVLLYLWRMRPRRRPVATGFLWEQVFLAPHRRAAWWSYRHPVSLCLQLLMLALVVFALAEPSLRPPLRVVLIIDHSASMNATDVQPTRLGKAKALAQDRIAALEYRDQMAIITAGDTVQVVCGLTSRKDTLTQALRAVRASNGPTRVADASAFARRLLQGEQNGRIVVLTDGCFDGAAELAAQDDVELIVVGGAGDNVAITRLEARPSLADPIECQVLVAVTSFASEPVECRLELEWDGKPIDAVPIELAAAGQWQRVFQMTTAEGGRLTARLDRLDALASDNRASIRLPARPLHQVTLVTKGNLYLEKVLQANPLVELTVTGALPERAATGAILVLEGRMAVAVSDGPTLVVDPSGPCELWELGERLEKAAVARANESLPLLADVRLEGVELSNLRRLALADKVRSMAQPVAWTADGTVVGYAIDRPGGRVVVLSGVLEGGDLSLRTAFPILIANALEWLAGSEGTSAPALEAGIGARSGRRDQETSAGGESDLRVHTDLASRAHVAVPGPSGPALWLFPAALALLLVAVEWYLFQRRWTC